MPVQLLIVQDEREASASLQRM